MSQSPSAQTISHHIIQMRGLRVMLDVDLAALYGVPTKRLNEQVRRNAARFPADFMFQLSTQEWDSLRPQFATLDAGRGRHRKYLPLAFTEHGAIMAATILNSPHAIQVALYVVRAFVLLRDTAQLHKELAAKLEGMEERIEVITLKHEHFSTTTRLQLKQVFDAIRQLMNAPAAKSRPIGFVLPKKPTP